VLVPIARVAAKALFLTLVLSILTVLAPPAEEALVHSPLLAVRSVEVSGMSALTAAEIARVAGVSVGMPFLAVDTHGAKMALARIPRIASATVERRLWGHVLVRVRERTACGLVVPAAETDARPPLELARDGMLMSPVDPARDSDLPVITGLVGAEAYAGQIVPPERVAPIGALLGLLARPDVKLVERISTIDASRPDSLVLTTVGTGTRILLPDRALTATDLLALRAVLADAEERGVVAGEVDLRFAGQVVLRPDSLTPQMELAEAVPAAMGDTLGALTADAPLSVDVASVFGPPAPQATTTERAPSARTAGQRTQHAHASRPAHARSTRSDTRRRHEPVIVGQTHR
jgi:cell division protein FtsQ